MAAPDLQYALDALERQDLGAATASLEHTVDVLPAHLAAHVLLARAYEAQERWDSALREWAQVQMLLPNSPVVQEGKARVLRAMGRAEAGDGTPALSDILGEPNLGSGSDETEPAGVAPELDALRRRAEEEARQGGARADRPPPDVDATGADAPDADAADAGAGGAGAAEAGATDESATDTPEGQVDQWSGDTDDLDRLIDELESARIEPSPDASADDPADVPEPSAGDEDELVSETLARIYASQEQYEEAAQVYERLAEQEPKRADAFREKAAEMRAQADDE